jgi:hypothetical protein
MATPYPNKIASLRLREKRKHLMSNRIAIASLAVLLLSACDQPKDPATQAQIEDCKGLNEIACKADGECNWKAEKSKCKRIKSKDTAPEQSSPGSVKSD